MNSRQGRLGVSEGDEWQVVHYAFARDSQPASQRVQENTDKGTCPQDANATRVPTACLSACLPTEEI